MKTKKMIRKMIRDMESFADELADLTAVRTVQASTRAPNIPRPRSPADVAIVDAVKTIKDLLVEIGRARDQSQQLAHESNRQMYELMRALPQFADPEPETATKTEPSDDGDPDFTFQLCRSNRELGEFAVEVGVERNVARRELDAARDELDRLKSILADRDESIENLTNALNSKQTATHAGADAVCDECDGELICLECSSAGRTGREITAGQYEEWVERLQSKLTDAVEAKHAAETASAGDWAEHVGELNEKLTDQTRELNKALETVTDLRKQLENRNQTDDARVGARDREVNRLREKIKQMERDRAATTENHSDQMIQVKSELGLNVARTQDERNVLRLAVEHYATDEHLGVVARDALGIVDLPIERRPKWAGGENQCDPPGWAIR